MLLQANRNELETMIQLEFNDLISQFFDCF